MIVRWVKKETNDAVKRDRLALEVVFESCGQQEHRVVPNNGSVQLGTIEERYLTANVRTLREFHQGLFWVSVDKILRTLNLDSVARHQIEQAASKKVPRPSEDWALWGVVCVPKFDS